MKLDQPQSIRLVRGAKAALATLVFGLTLAGGGVAEAQCIEECLAQRGECRDACLAERRDCVAGPREDFRICRVDCRELFDRETEGDDLRTCVRDCFDEHFVEAQAECRIDQRECRRSCDPGRCRRVCADDRPLPEELACVRDCTLDLRTCAREDRAALRTCLAP